MSELDNRARKGVVGTLLSLAVLIFLPAWSLSFWQGWLVLAIVTICVGAITAYFLKHDPALVARRMDVGPKAEKENRQRTIQTLSSVSLFALLVVPGLDHHFGWSQVPLPTVLAADAALIAGFALVFAVFKTNCYASAIVEVAADQKVISSGPYAAVRHPMYAGAVLLFVGTPLALGSYWGLIASIPMLATLVARLLDEERVLVKELPGYAEYRTRVRSRLVPGLW